MLRVRRESRKSVKPPRMVNCGMRMVNCRPRVTKHARRKITFFTEVRAPAKETRVKSYMQIISSLLGLLVACVTGNVYSRLVYIHCVRLLRYRSCPGWRASAYIIVLEGERMYVRLPRPLSRLSFFLLGRISMPTRDVGVQTRKGEGERECLKSRLMIRDDMRHSSLSDVWLDCRYCSLSFIFRELATDARVHASECA